MAQGFDSRLNSWCKQGKYQKLQEFITVHKDFPSRWLAYRSGLFGYTRLHEAVSKGHSEVLALLLQHGGDNMINYKCGGGYTPLHLAASSGDVSCVQVLLASNADISIVDGFGKTPLQTAELISKHAVAKVLRSAGEDEYLY